MRLALSAGDSVLSGVPRAPSTRTSGSVVWAKTGAARAVITATDAEMLRLAALDVALLILGSLDSEWCCAGPRLFFSCVHAVDPDEYCLQFEPRVNGNSTAGV
jgi:hypothetical protein